MDLIPRSITPAAVTRAMHEYERLTRKVPCPGICWAFAHDKLAFVVRDFLEVIGGEPDRYGYFWPRSDIESRRTMLAFMLAWAEDGA